MGVNVNAEELAKLIHMMDVDCSGSFMRLRHFVRRVACACVIDCACACAFACACTRASEYANKSREQQVQYLWRS
jgi:hypothetical protein